MGSAGEQARTLYTERVLNADGGDSGVRVLFLNRPERLNALSTEMASAFAEALDELRADGAARALVITGAGGRAFSAGGDFEFLEARMASTLQENEQALTSLYEAFLALRQLPIVSIAAVNGAAVGGGLGLAAAGDIRIASRSARLGYNFAKLGVSPGMGCTALLPAITNHQVACRLLLTGDIVSAQEAKDLGLVLDVVEPEQLLPAAKDLALRIAAGSPAAVAAALRMLRAGLPFERLQAVAREEARVQARLFLQSDVREGVAAVREKRQPVFSSSQAGSVRQEPPARGPAE